MKKHIRLHFFENKKWQKFFTLILCCVGLTLFSNLYAVNNQSSEMRSVDTFDIIMERIQTSHKNVNVTSIENNTTNYLSVINSDGSFPDINYNDQELTNWTPIGHLDRLKNIILAYTIENSKYFGDVIVYNTIVSMLNYWYDKHPISTNWYQQQIACPQRMGILLILMRSGSQQLPTDLEEKLLTRMETEGGRPDDPSHGTGANKLDIAIHWIYRGCLTKNTEVLSFGAEQVYYPIFLTTEEGLQHDFSYQQHGNQLYIGGYGHVFVNGITNISQYMVDTPYALSGEKLDLLSKFIRTAYIPVIRGKYMLYNVLGRGVSRKDNLNQNGFTTVINRMISLDPANTSEYEAAIKRLKQTEPANYQIKIANTHFWRSDYTLHQRSGYTFDVRSSSKYACKNENGNGENIKGYFMADGATEIVINGDEYTDIFPVWDWARIPGVTAPALTAIPKPAQWGQTGTSTFAGGVSDGTYGASAYWLDDKNFDINTTAKKAWFLFDDEIVCLGAGITSTATQSINTTLNQSLLQGDVIANADGTDKVLEKGSHTYTNPSWVLHNGVGYLFPEGGNITISNQEQSGKWSSINTSLTDEVVSKDIFKIWFDHGVKPVNKGYSYIIVPNKNTVDEMKAYSSANIEVLSNTDLIQAVRHKELNILSLIFYKAGIFKSEDISISTDGSCTLLLKNIGTPEVEIYVSDPSRSKSNLSIRTELPLIEGLKELKCELPKYPDAYAGSTFKYTIDKNTPEYSSVHYKYIYTSEDAWVRDGAYGDTNYGTAKTLVVKKDGVGYNREAYVKFDLQNVDVTKYDNISLVMYVANANISIQEIQWNIEKVSNANWSEDSITWNNKPIPDTIIATVDALPAGSNIMADITQAVLEEVQKGSKILTLRISAANTGTDGKTDAQFYSKEGNDPLKMPQLVLESRGILNTESVEVVTSDDAWVRDGNYATTNYGATNTLTIKKDNGVGYNREVYFKFNLENTSFDEINDVKLELSVSYANVSIASTDWQVKPVDNTWTESTLTWDNAPEAIGGVIATNVGLPVGSRVLFDITEYVRSQYEKGNKVISLQVSATSKGEDGKTDAKFHSKEATNASKHPKLVIEGKQLASKLRFVELSNDITAANVMVYPNPILKGSTLNIDFPKETTTAEIRVMDLSGRTLIVTKDHSIDSSRLLPGVYILSIKDNKNPELNESIKLIVK